MKLTSSERAPTRQLPTEGILTVLHQLIIHVVQYYCEQHPRQVTKDNPFMTQVQKHVSTLTELCCITHITVQA